MSVISAYTWTAAATAHMTAGFTPMTHQQVWWQGRQEGGTLGGDRAAAQDWDDRTEALQGYRRLVHPLLSGLLESVLKGYRVVWLSCSWNLVAPTGRLSIIGVGLSVVWGAAAGAAAGCWRNVSINVSGGGLLQWILIIRAGWSVVLALHPTHTCEGLQGSGFQQQDISSIHIYSTMDQTDIGVP